MGKVYASFFARCSPLRVLLFSPRNYGIIIKNMKLFGMKIRSVLFGKAQKHTNQLAHCKNLQM
jgi:hypothetical protein